MGGAAPRLSGLAYAHWVPLFINWAIRNGVEAALQREIPELAAKLAAAERWEQEAEDSAFLTALGGSSSSSSPPMKAEDKAAEAAGFHGADAGRLVPRCKNGSPGHGGGFRRTESARTSGLPSIFATASRCSA